MAIDEALLRHLYQYDPTLPLIPTSEPEPVLDESTLAPVAGLRRERVTFGSVNDQRVLATLTTPETGGPFAALILQHGSTPLGRHSWNVRRPLHTHWAQHGFLTVAVDAPGFGSREAPDDRGRLRPDRPDLLFRTRDNRMQAVRDLMRTVDYLLSRDDVRGGAIGYLGISMGCRIGVPFFGLDRRVRAAAFFVGGSGAYSRFALEDSKFEHLRADEQLFFELTDPIAFAHMSAGRPVFLANGRRDDLVGLEAAERLQQAMGEPKTLRWFDGGHAESPLALFDEARDFLLAHLRA